MTTEGSAQEEGAPGVPLDLAYDEALVRERAMLAAAVDDRGEGGAGSASLLSWMLWRTGPCIVAPRTIMNRPAFARAAAASAARGWPVHIRDTGGGAVAQGPGVVNLSMTFPIGAGSPDRIGASYRVLCAPVMAMLRRQGVEGAYRAIPGTMCDGAYNIVVGGRKLAGTAQRWRSLGRDQPGAHAVLAHLALFVDLDQAAAAEALNALYADMGIDAGIAAASHINWAEIEAPAGTPPGGAAAAARELDAACRALRLDELPEPGIRLPPA